MTSFSTSDEKITAALVHGSIFLVFLGPIVPILVWASQRKKSKYVSFHALQAMSYQVLMFWLWIILMPLIAILIVLLTFPFAALLMRDSNNEAFIPLVLQLIIFLTMFGSMALFFLVGMIGAVYCVLGRDFRYPLIGKWLAQYLSYDVNSDALLDETHEENLVAAIGHATAILQLWGIITPLVVWFTQKERSARLRFQSLQAAIYQGIAFVAYMLGMVIYMVFLFGMMFLLFTAGVLSKSNEIQGPAAAILLAFFGMMILFWFVFLLFLPIYYVLAGIGSVRVIRGHHFRYPILGKILERRLERSQTSEALP